MTAALARRSAAVEETERWGAALAPALQCGDVLALSGPLGAGKTRFVAGLARGLAAAARVRSPTYTLVNEYPGRLMLAHLDLYRVTTSEAEALGLEEYLERGVLVVEWGEKLPAPWRAEALTLEFAILSERERVITASARAGRGVELLAAWRNLDAAARPAHDAAAGRSDR